ncbi:hypothetical protein R3P38DRAFT_3347183 [Favolaschia claudopus]|uniref:Uncharacterized protein n=1 Tax=Favolaschia claudopus TaxID=2862362 RepID=A0AAW0D3X5_9AGAR
MVNPYLDWIWSKYANTPEQGMLSLRETCSALLKYTLVPSDMILSGGGYILHHNLATPLSNVVCAMDYLLDLSAKHVGFVKIPTIGYTELNILSGTGIQHGLATQSQIVASWVSILDHICAAKYQLKALCSGDTTHSSLHAWVSQVDTFASSLPLELRKKLPTDLVERFGMEAEERSPPTAPGSKIHSPPASTAMSSSSTFSPRIPSNLLSAPSLFTLVPDGKIYAADTSLESIWIHELGKGRCVLNKELLYFVMDTVRRMQAILTQTFTPLRGQTGCFQIDPNGELEQTLHSANTLESLDSAWGTLVQRMREANACFKEYQQRRRSPSAVDDSYVESLLAAHGRQGEHKMLKKGEDLPAEFIETQNNSLLTETPCRSLTVPSGIDGNGRAFKYSWSRSPSPSSGIAELQTSLLSTSSPAHPLHLEENGCLQIESNQLRSRATQKCRDAPIALIDESIPTAPPPASSFPTPDAARVAENSKLQTSATENASLDHLVLPTVNSLVDAAAEGEPTGLSSYSLGLRSAFVAANTTSSLVIRDNESRRELQDNDKQSVELRTTPIEGRRKKTRLKKEEQALAELEQEVKSSLLTDRLSSSLAAPPNIDEVTYKPLRMDGVDERRAPNLAVGYTGRMTEVSSSKYWRMGSFRYQHHKRLSNFWMDSISRSQNR